jgi:hypothetical protein
MTRLSDVKEKLPLDGQKWIASMSGGELFSTPTILQTVGEQKFVENWTKY